MIMQKIAEVKKKFKEVVDDFSKDIAKFRTGRASSSILDGILVPYYGIPTPINQMATVSVPEANLIIIQPWDPKVLADIEKAIRQTNMNMNPISDGKQIKLPIPPLDEQRRLEIIKTLKVHTEERKTVIRNIRREYRELAKKMKDDKIISEDDERRFFDDLQKNVDEYIKKIEEIEKSKASHILED